GQGGAVYNTGLAFLVSAFTRPDSDALVPGPGSFGALVVLNLLNGNTATGGAGGAGGNGAENGLLALIGTEADGGVGGECGAGGDGGAGAGGAVFNTASGGSFSILGFSLLSQDASLDFLAGVGFLAGVADGASFTVQFNVLDDNTAAGGLGGAG